MYIEHLETLWQIWRSWFRNIELDLTIHKYHKGMLWGKKKPSLWVERLEQACALTCKRSFSKAHGHVSLISMFTFNDRKSPIVVEQQDDGWWDAIDEPVCYSRTEVQTSDRSWWQNVQLRGSQGEGVIFFPWKCGDEIYIWEIDCLRNSLWL